MNAEERPSKLEAFLSFFKEGWVSVHLDARRAGVAVPPDLAKNAHLVLQYGHNMPLPIHDLQVNETGISATLSFSRTPHVTMVPWSAVYVVACTDGRGVIYYEDVPDEVSLAPGPDPDDIPAPAATAAPVRASAPPRTLRSIPAAEIPDATRPDQAGSDSAAPRRRKPQLRLVK